MQLPEGVRPQLRHEVAAEHQGLEAGQPRQPRGRDRGQLIVAEVKWGQGPEAVQGPGGHGGEAARGEVEGLQLGHRGEGLRGQGWEVIVRQV